MAISFTFCGDNLIRGGPVLPNAPGTRVDVANGAASAAVSASGYYRIVASTSSYVLVGPSVTDGTGGEHWPAGHVEVRRIASGDKIGCSAGA